MKKHTLLQLHSVEAGEGEFDGEEPDFRGDPHARAAFDDGRVRELRYTGDSEAKTFALTLMTVEILRIRHERTQSASGGRHRASCVADVDANVWLQSDSKGARERTARSATKGAFEMDTIATRKHTLCRSFKNYADTFLNV